MVNLRALLSERRVRLGLLSGGGLALTAACVVLANLLSLALHARLDLSASRRYSLSEPSRALLKSLEDPLLLRFYVSPALPQPYDAASRYVRDLLEEYRAAGRGRVKLEVLDPESSPEAKAAALAAGLTPARFTQVAGDEFQMREGFFGVAMLYQDKQRVLPFVKDAASLEYDVSSRVKQMVSTKKRTLAFVTGHGEMTAAVFGPLFEGFETVALELSTAAAAPDALLVLGPREPFTAAEIAALDGLLARGVPAGIFLGRKLVDLGRFSFRPLETGLEPWLAHYGAGIGTDFVFDAQCQRVSLRSEQGGMTLQNILNYPAMPLSNRLNKEHPATRALDVLGFPFAHPLAPSGTGLKFTPLAESTERSWTPLNLASLDPYGMRGPAEEDPRGPFTLAASVEGSTSAYSDPSKKIDSLRLVLVGTAEFADPRLPSPESNPAFLLALAEWLAQDPHLLAIPPKGSPYRPVKQLSDGARRAVKLGGFFFLPAAVLAGALWRWKRRRARRLEAARIYRPAP